MTLSDLLDQRKSKAMQAELERHEHEKAKLKQRKVDSFLVIQKWFKEKLGCEVTPEEISFSVDAAVATYCINPIAKLAFIFTRFGSRIERVQVNQGGEGIVLERESTPMIQQIEDALLMFGASKVEVIK
jgi:hypothetical protein